MYLPYRPSHFSVNDDYLLEIYNIILNNPIYNILDLGAGRTSIFLKKYCSYANLYSIESNINYYNELLSQCQDLKDNLYLCEEIVDRNNSITYYKDLDKIINDTKFDLISIDGPTGYMIEHPRQNIIDIINNKQLNTYFHIIIHDAERNGEKNLAQQIFSCLEQNNYQYQHKYLHVQHGAILIYNNYNTDKIFCPCCKNFINKDSLEHIGVPNPMNSQYYIIGAGYRKVKCNICGSIDRSRLLYTYLSTLDIKNKNILHVAPENDLNVLFTEANRYEKICNFSEAYDNPNDTSVKNIDVCNMKCYEDDLFDLIICSHVLEHVDDEFKAITELYRILKPGGILILQVPLAIGLDNTLNKTANRELDYPTHKRLYGDNYQKIISMYGFKCEKVYLSNKYKEYGLNNLEYVNVFIK